MPEYEKGRLLINGQIRNVATGVVLLGSVLVWLALPKKAITVPPASGRTDLSGVYRCEGKGYKGLTIIRKSGEGYQLLWTIGSKTHFGVAIQEGSWLSSSWSIRGMEMVPGIVVYRIEEGGVLRGKYTSFPGGILETETLTYQGPVQ